MENRAEQSGRAYRPSGRAGAIPAPVLGALYMTLACFCFAIMNGLIRYASESVDPLEIAFFRNLFALLCMMPWLMRVGWSGLKTERLSLHLWRGVIGLIAMISWFTSVALLPLSEAVALNFTVPLFATIGAALVLGEVVRARRWTATAIGFLGVLVILRPGFQEVSLLIGLPILSALFMASSILIVKSLSSSESPEAIVLYMNLLLTPLSFVPALFVWTWPDLWPLAAMAAVGFFAVIAHLSITRAYAVADASAIVPFDYMRLPFVAVIAWIFFGQATDLWTWLGAGIIAASSIYIARREARIAKERRTGQLASAAARERTP